jgi:hypothetical protein
MKQIVLVVMAVGLIGCGGGGSDGEPIGGTIAFTVGTETIVPSAGAALQLEETPADQMVILIATSEARCGITGMGDPPDWFLEAQVSNQAPGTWQTAIFLAHIAGQDDSYSSFGSGTIVIDSIGAERVTGSIDYMDTATDPPASITGTFDIIRCF